MMLWRARHCGSASQRSPRSSDSAYAASSDSGVALRFAILLGIFCDCWCCGFSGRATCLWTREAQFHQKTLHRKTLRVRVRIPRCTSRTREAELHQQTFTLDQERPASSTRTLYEILFCRVTVLCESRRPNFTSRLCDCNSVGGGRATCSCPRRPSCIRRLCKFGF